MPTNVVNTPSPGHRPLPDGEYMLEICEAEYVPNTPGEGMVLKCKAQIVGGDHDGRPYYLNYVLEDAAPAVVERGQRDFAALRWATGALKLDVPEELHFKKFSAKIGHYTSKDTGEPENVIRQYLFDDDSAVLRRAVQ